MLVENLRLAFTSLLANKSRALLTMLGIIIGIASVIAIMTVGNSMTTSVSNSLQSMGANNITVSLQQLQSEAEERENGIVFGETARQKEATEEDYFTDEMIYALIADITILGASMGYFKANEITVLAGRNFSLRELQQAREVAVVSSKFVDELFGGDCDNALGKTVAGEVNHQTVEYTIIGVYQEEETGGFFASDRTNVYIPLTVAQNFSHKRNYASFSVVAKAGMDSNVLAERIETYMKGYYRGNRYFTVRAYSMASMVSIMSGMLSTIVSAIAVIAGIALVVGGIGVMNIMLVSVTERTREIGTRKALGADNASIRMQFIIEAMIICLMGGIIGVLLGVLLGILAANLLGSAAAPSVSSILVSLGFSLAIGVFFGYYPANKAAKMNPIDALQYE